MMKDALFSSEDPDRIAESIPTKLPIAANERK